MNRLVVFIDGACEPKNPGGVATYGFAIYRDGEKLDEGSGLAADPWTEQASNNVAEYTALIRALEKVLAIGLGGSEVEVRSDSALLVQQVNGKYAVRALRLKPLHERVIRLLPQFKSIHVQWIPREENVEADALTRRAYETYVLSAPGHDGSATFRTKAKPTGSTMRNSAEHGFMFCSRCGTKIPLDSKFCKACGTRLS